MEGRRVGLVYDEHMCAHKAPEKLDHPEKPERILAIAQRLKSAGAFQRCLHVKAREARDDELAAVHTMSHIKLMRNISNRTYLKEIRRRLAQKYNSIYFNKGTSKSALLAAGSVVELSLQVAQGELEAGAAIVRPPGHHAESDAPMGFCVFNNVAVAAHVLVHEKPELGVSKVLIVDWDVHHGNGTQHTFWNDPQVLYFSVHRYDDGSFYPSGDEGNFDKVGDGNGIGFNINVPWPHGGFGDADYLAVWDYVLLPIAKEFNPDIVLISGGFDSAEGDPLGGCRLTPYGYSQMTHKLMNLARGRVVLVLEGGYNLKSIAESYLSCLQILLGDQPLNSVSFPAKAFPSTWFLIEEVEGMAKKCIGSINKDPPSATTWMQIDHQLFFGRTDSQTWGSGGVAFLELKPTDGVLTHIRLYKITVEQFNDLFIQENMVLADESDLINVSFVHNLCQQSSSSAATSAELVKDGWYGTVLYLGEKDGFPIFTFTCSESHAEKFKSGILPVCPPSEAYQWAVATGLIKDMGLSKEDALNYILSKV